MATLSIAPQMQHTLSGEWVWTHPDAWSTEDNNGEVDCEELAADTGSSQQADKSKLRVVLKLPERGSLVTTRHARARRGLAGKLWRTHSFSVDCGPWCCSGGWRGSCCV